MHNQQNKLVILDRDGVINHDSDLYIKSLDEFVVIESSITAIVRLSKAGFNIAIATNQSGIGRGFYAVDDLMQMHNKLCSLITQKGGKLGMIQYCPHLPSDNCKCRKPNPLMLNQILKYYDANPKNIYFVGDSLTDLLAAKNAGCKSALVKTGKGTKTLQKILMEYPCSKMKNVGLKENLDPVIASELQINQTFNLESDIKSHVLNPSKINLPAKCLVCDDLSHFANFILGFSMLYQHFCS